jgi:iron complex outermembrane receptor protein
VRYTKEHHTLDGSLDSVNLTPGGPVPSTEPFGGNTTFDSTTWKAGIEYDVAHETMLYFTASTGFKSGGINQEPALVANQNVYQPETLTAYEFGARNRFFDQRLQVNAALFRWNYHDHQESVITFDSTDSVNFLTVNAGDATISGASLDIQALVTTADTFRVYGEYNQGKYDSFTLEPAAFTFNPASTSCPYGPPHPNGSGLPVVTVNCAGFQLARDPKWTGSAGWEHRFKLNNGAQIVSNATALFSSWRWGAVDFTAYEKLPSYAIGNFDLSYITPKSGWNFTAFVHNVSNEAVATGAIQQAFAPPAAYLSMQPPRTYGARATFSF